MRRGARIVGAVFAGVAMAWACTFPSPELRDVLPLDAAPGPDSALPDGPSLLDVEALDAANPDALPPPDADRVDGDAMVTAPDGQVVDCDEDRDRFAKVGGVCGGFDCNDQNGNVRPDQGFTTLAPVAGSGPGTRGDWNCNGTVEYELKVGVDERCPILAFACGQAGFVSPNPTCGSMARFVVCEKDGLGCKKTVDVQRPVGCR
jgi:hypothetical protein